MEVEIKNPIEEACTEFSAYLNISGAAEAASTALLDLFLLLEKPENPIEFVRENLDQSLNVELAKLKDEVELAKEELAEMNELIAELKAKSIKLIEEGQEGDELLDDSVEDAVTEPGLAEGTPSEENPETNEKPSEENNGTNEEVNKGAEGVTETVVADKKPAE